MVPIFSLVGVSRLERETFCVSSKRSNQLSYTPYFPNIPRRPLKQKRAETASQAKTSLSIKMIRTIQSFFSNNLILKNRLSQFFEIKTEFKNNSVFWKLSYFSTSIVLTGSATDKTFSSFSTTFSKTFSSVFDLAISEKNKYQAA